ncbi:sugar MFS transporter [Flagellimonas hymeniacidonis]|uniref:Sugar MFS transporter n=1 Tax=Flagellimonas hymeniacidonis TaxID=2603628 RepID=A0A5C8V6E5_9FLAO|nr:sugar MFS transporter [Flagellimonas hymeniacidonis]TXN37272.1 sugar MFS transporter [Flagellimonas hymeniacidonis]
MASIPSSNVAQSNGPTNYRKPFLTITFLFFMWGFITVMNDVLIPHLKEVFELSYFQAALIQFAFFGAFFIISLIYFIVSVSKGDPISKIGYKNGIIIGLILCGLGCCLFYPAAIFQRYGIFLSALFVLASGVTILQIAANPYAAILGKPETASSRLNLAQGFNSFGATLAPLVGALLLYKVFSNGEITVDSLKMPYLIYGGLFFLLALIIKFIKLPSFKNTETLEKGLHVLKFKHVVLGMIAIFVYVGGEVTIGSFLINFFKLDSIAGMDEAQGGVFLSYYWGGAMIGRFLGSIAMGSMTDKLRKYLLMACLSILSFMVIYLVTGVQNNDGVFSLELIPFAQIQFFIFFLVINYVAFLIGGSKPSRVLTLFASIVIILLGIMIVANGAVAFWSAIAIGAFNSILWSNIFTLAIKDLGKYTSQASSLLVMMIVGGAIIPIVQGAIADEIGIQLSFIVPIFCYAYLIFYGLKGYQVKPIKN